MLEKFIEMVEGGRSLDVEQVGEVVEALTSADVAPEKKADFLIALTRRGESPEEIAHFASILRGMSVQPPLSETLRKGVLLDTCGTGGDKLNTFNISTTVALLCAGAGVKVTKHGNRAITSKSGSADVLEKLGIPVTLTPEEAARTLEEKGFAFLFAPHYHPAFKHIAPARRICAERGSRTIFNFLGPLLNPARPDTQLLGVARPELCEPLAKVLQSIGLRRAMVVCGKVGDACLDELSTLGETTVAEFYQDRGFNVSTLSERDFPMQPASIRDLQVGEGESSEEIVLSILGGREKGPRRDAVLLNAGAALFVSEKAPSITEGWDLAEKTIDSGAAMDKLEQLRSS